MSDRLSRINRMVSLKVDNILGNTTKHDLKTIFERVGPVGDICIPLKKYTRETRGFAFVRYFNERDANDAILRLNGSCLNGNTIYVKRALIPLSYKHISRIRPSESRSYYRSRSPQRRSYSRYRSPVRRSCSRYRSHRRRSYSTSRSPVRRSYSRSSSSQRRSYSTSRSSRRRSYTRSRSP